ncbi:MAG: hypothetical protein CFH05_01563 [Alphaproteobacteria bacterium MarineAlpha3_Bin4]|nr:MAG: hypothetical protein CFH05_01563 [Alphaproteobacteria bacterium MarineAlpha3_Bin4]
MVAVGDSHGADTKLLSFFYDLLYRLTGTVLAKAPAPVQEGCRAFSTENLRFGIRYNFPRSDVAYKSGNG